jgi:hypothetical protein
MKTANFLVLTVLFFIICYFGQVYAIDGQQKNTGFLDQHKKEDVSIQFMPNNGKFDIFITSKNRDNFQFSLNKIDNSRLSIFQKNKLVISNVFVVKYDIARSCVIENFELDHFKNKKKSKSSLIQFDATNDNRLKVEIFLQKKTLVFFIEQKNNEVIIIMEDLQVRAKSIKINIANDVWQIVCD